MDDDANDAQSKLEQHNKRIARETAEAQKRQFYVWARGITADRVKAGHRFYITCNGEDETGKVREFDVTLTMSIDRGYMYAVAVDGVISTRSNSISTCVSELKSYAPGKEDVVKYGDYHPNELRTSGI